MQSQSCLMTGNAMQSQSSNRATVLVYASPSPQHRKQGTRRVSRLYVHEHRDKLRNTSWIQFTGDLKKVIIRTKESGSHPGWHLSKVKVKDLWTDQVYEFPASKWLYTGTYTFYEKSKKSEWNGKKFVKIKRDWELGQCQITSHK